jgi:predicted nucleotidyltransferase component of viral defense system
VSRAPTKGTIGGRTYLALQKKARQDGRPTDELLQLLALETFLDRLSTSSASKDLVLKGGVLLAAYEMRRPTRDVDLSARGLTNSVESTIELVRAILAQERDDGWTFGTPTGEAIRQEDAYSGVRVTVLGALATARVSFHVDINFGDPIWPAPTEVIVPRLLGGSITIRGYSVAMIHAEKIVTAIQRGTANTRWRDYADIYLLSGRHAVNATDLSTAIAKVAAHRQANMILLSDALDGFAALAQARWSAWVRRQRMQDRLPLDFSELLDAVLVFAGPLLAGTVRDLGWDPQTRSWTKS